MCPWFHFDFALLSKALCACVWARLEQCVGLCVFMCIWVSMFVSLCLCLFLCICVCICALVFVSVCLCLYLCACACDIEKPEGWPPQHRSSAHYTCIRASHMVACTLGVMCNMCTIYTMCTVWFHMVGCTLCVIEWSQEVSIDPQVSCIASETGRGHY